MSSGPGAKAAAPMAAGGAAKPASTRAPAARPVPANGQPPSGPGATPAARHAAPQANGNAAAMPTALPMTQRPVPPTAGAAGKAAPQQPPAAAAGAKRPAGATPSSTSAQNGAANPPSMIGKGDAGGSSYGFGGPMQNSAYPGSFMQQPGANGAPAGGNPYGGGSMYGGMGGGSMYGPQGGPAGSMYGMPSGAGNMMYNSAYGTSMMGPMNGGSGSMYGMGGMGGMGGSMGSAGAGYGFGSSFGGSLYGGSLYGSTGSLYGTGGSLYGSNDQRAVMSSMYGSRNGSIYGGFGSMYAVGGPHTGLGTVKKYDLPGFSYSMGSNLGLTPYHRDNSFNAGGAKAHKRGDNSFRGTSSFLRENEYDLQEKDSKLITATQREKELEEKKTPSGPRGVSGVDKDGKTVEALQAKESKEAKKAKEAKPKEEAAAPAAAEKAEAPTTTANRTAPAVLSATSTEAPVANKPASIMKKRSSVEAPKSPPSMRAAKTGATQPLVLSSDFRIHNVVVIEQEAKDADVAAAKVTQNGAACAMEGKTYAVDEVLEYKPADKKATIDSQQVRDMIEHVLAGHNTALLVSDDGKATASAKTAVETMVTKLMEALNAPSRNIYAGVSASMCGLHPNNMVRDLFADGSSPKPLEVGNSPLFGPAAMNMTTEPITSGADFQKVYEAALKREAKETLMVCMLTVKQIRASAASDGKEEVFLSSVLIGVSRRGPREFHDIVDKVSTASHDLFRYAVDGPSVCVHLFAIYQGSTDAQALVDCAKIGEVQNSAPRSGNVRRFVEFTEDQLRRMRERGSTATGSDKAELEGHVKRLQLILDDARKLLTDPRNTEAKVYRLDSDADSNAEKAEAAKEEPHKSREVEPAAAEKKSTADEKKSTPDEKMRAANVSTVAIVDGTEGRAYTVKDNVITASGRPFTVDEVIQKSALQPNSFESKPTDKVLAAFLKGYNGAVIASDSVVVAPNGMESPTMGVVHGAVKGALAKPGCKGVRVSIALVRDTGVATDLTPTSAATGASTPIEVSSSPLFGPILHNATLHRVHSTEELQKLVDKARAQAAPVWDEHCVIHVTVVHCYADKEDVFVSSLLATFSSANSKINDQVLQPSSATADGSAAPPAALSNLYRYAFGGAATTAYVVSLSGKDDVSDAVASLGTQSTASAVRNRSPRQGSIKNFISYTKASLDKRRDHLATLPEDSKERALMLKVVAPMERMLGDHEKVIEDPENNFPRAYAAESGATANHSASPPPVQANGVAPSVAAPAKPDAPASTTTAGSNGEAQQHEDPSSGFTEPRVVVFVSRDVTAEEKKLSLGGKDYAVDELVKLTRTPTSISTGPSVSIAEIESRFSGVHNCSLVSASAVKDGSTKEEPVWMFFEQCLRGAMSSTKAGATMRVDLTFAAVSANELLVDLLADAKDTSPEPVPRPLEIASSPIYGPRVNNVTIVSVQSSGELGSAMETAHKRAQAQLEAIRTGDVMMVGTAVMRRKTDDGDVQVASLLGTLTGRSAVAYQEALEKAPVVRRALLSCAFGGPSATVAIINLAAEDEAAQATVSTVVTLSKRQRNLVSRSGSVQAFVKYTEGTMKREQARAASAADETKERHQQKAARLLPVVEDHKKLLADFAAPIPAYATTRSGNKSDREDGIPSPTTATAAANTANPAPAASTPSTTSKASAEPKKDRSASPTTAPAPAATATTAAANGAKKESTPNRIRTVVVVTPRRTTAASAAAATIARMDECHIKAAYTGADREVTCDEAVARPDSSSNVRADTLNAVTQQFVTGFNAALLCCDLGGSNAGPVACVRTVHKAMEAKPATAEVFLSINCVKKGMSKDMLRAPHGDYAAMKVGNSPIFGPWVYGCEMRPLADASQFDTAFSAACAEAAKDNAMVIAGLVLKIIQGDGEQRDVVVSSLLMSLATEPQAYTEVVDAPLKSDRKLFQYSVQGSCFTVGLLGVSDSVDQEGLAGCFDAFEKLHATVNRPMRNGSVRRFLAYSLNATADVKSRAEKVTDERQRAVYEQRLASLEQMVADSRALLESPEGQQLKIYL